MGNHLNLTRKPQARTNDSASGLAGQRQVYPDGRAGGWGICHGHCGLHVFLLRKIDELSYGEIAARLGISEKTMQRQLVKAMLHCHRRMNPHA